MTALSKDSLSPQKEVYISAFDMFKLGVGPSSSHTLGPWRAAEDLIHRLKAEDRFTSIKEVTVTILGSLAKTGKGHYTPLGVMLGLKGLSPETISNEDLKNSIAEIAAFTASPAQSPTLSFLLDNSHPIPFHPKTHIHFDTHSPTPHHPNTLTFTLTLQDDSKETILYCSIGGGFITTPELAVSPSSTEEAEVAPLYPITTAQDILNHAAASKKSLYDIILINERVKRSDDIIDQQIKTLFETMLNNIYIGLHTPGTLPGGLNVKRRAPDLYQGLLKEMHPTSPHRAALIAATTPGQWLTALIASRIRSFTDVTRWVSAFAIAVNEENAGMARIVTAPTNGAAGIIPAALIYALAFCDYTDIEDTPPSAALEQDNAYLLLHTRIKTFLFIAACIGALFKQGATISAAAGGCQAEIGVSASMAAAALTYLSVQDIPKTLMAAEIAIEHHLGLTCDPIGGLVQIPCIERNAIGVTKSITSAQLAITGSPSTARVSLDEAIATMWKTAQDMLSQYKETSQGGLAVTVSVAQSEC